jgi:hypothetical protein
MHVIPRGVLRPEESGFTLHTGQKTCTGLTQILQSPKLHQNDKYLSADSCK